MFIVNLNVINILTRRKKNSNSKKSRKEDPLNGRNEKKNEKIATLSQKNTPLLSWLITNKSLGSGEKHST